MTKPIAREFRTEHGVELVMTEPISQMTAERLIAQLSALKGNKITLSIFSGGGDAFAGFALYDYITANENSLTVETRVYGMAASAAMIVAAAGSPRLIGESSMAMIHPAFSMAEEVDEKDQAVLDSMNQRQAEIFASITGRAESSISRLMKEDRFMDAEEAVRLGFFDRTIAQAKMAAHFNNTMSETKTGTRKFKVSSGEALSILASAAKAVASGELDLPETAFPQVTPAVPDTSALDTEIADLKAKLVLAETAKATAEAEKATEVTAKTEAEGKLVAMTTERDTFKATVETLSKSPMVAKFLADGAAEVVVPGVVKDETPKVPMSAKAERAQKAQSLWDEAKKQTWGDPAQA